MHRAHTIPHRRALLDDAQAILEREFADDVRLDDVARRVATSRRQLQRCFSELEGESFRDCLTRVRMERAADMLRTGRLPVRRVAHAVGYQQPAQFAKAFRRHHGTSPTEYRFAAAQAPARDERWAA